MPSIGKRLPASPYHLPNSGRSAAWRQSGARKLEDARRGVSAVAGARVNRVNAVVVGAGAAGGIVAKELAEAGLSVVLLERGKRYAAFICRKDDLRNQRTSVLGNAFGP